MTPSDKHKQPTRRAVASMAAAYLLAPKIARAQARDIWSVEEAYEALLSRQIVILDVRSRAEWQDTGVGDGVWPVSLHEDGFERRLFSALALAEPRPLALICATGGRSAYVLRALRNAGISTAIDVSEGMLGSRRGPGWIKSGLPVVPLETALQKLPEGLKGA